MILKLFFPICLLFICCFTSCEKQTTKLEIALELAGENRTELQKVLDYYSCNASDSLKYRAACFLIENMPYYHYYEGEQLDNYAEYYKMLAEERALEPQKILDSVILQYGTFSLKALNVKYDINEIDSAYLCNNIEWSFKVWQEQPWCKSVDFDSFCEFILPYRLGNERPVYWKENLYNCFNRLFKNAAKIVDIENPVTAARILTDSIKKTEYRFTTTAPPNFPSLGPDVSHYLTGTCQNITDFTMYACRAVGIPCHLDFFPLRGDENNGHFWVSYYNNDQELYIQDFLGQITPVRSSHLRGFKELKTYRYTFSHDLKTLERMTELETSVYSFFKQCNFTDVSVYYADYFAQNVTVPQSFFYSKERNSKIAYLCLANRTQWTPVAWAPYNKSELQFENLAKGSVVRVATWENEELVFQTPPFLITVPNGELMLFTENSEPDDVILFAKMNLKADEIFLKRMLHGVFEASNTPDFKEVDTLFHIVEKPYRLLTTVKTNNTNKYRYVRYFGPKDGFCNISEVAFYENADSAEPLQGEIIGTEGYWGTRKQDFRNVFDGKTDTSFNYKEGYGGWSGLDLGDPKSISTIVYTPRNRDNFVRPKDTYELFYCGEQGWVSLGIQVAQSDSLLYAETPKNALFLLRNHSRGVQERIFMVKNNRQKWL